ncbi:MAG: ABC transporter ATP-binding protein, partial [Clostridiaceae bacterium]
MLEVKAISKAFGTQKVIKDLSFTINEHSIYGFIGKNGAGKTTTMKMILGLYPCDRGEIYVNGEQVRYGIGKTNSYIGYLPDVPEFYDFMNPMEYLSLCGEISLMDKKECRKRSGELLEAVGLEAAVRKRIKGFSRGMKQRLGIAQALLNKPKL